jgi:hypothetical protein
VEPKGKRFKSAKVGIWGICLISIVLLMLFFLTGSIGHWIKNRWTEVHDEDYLPFVENF